MDPAKFVKISNFQIKPLSSQNEWPVWKRKIRDLLDYHDGALSVVDGKIGDVETPPENASEEELKKFQKYRDFYRKANSIAKSTIASAVTDEVYQKIMDSRTAYEAWKALEVLFEQTSKDQVYQLCNDFFSMKWTKTEDVSTHIAKLKNIWYDLNSGLKARGEVELPNLLIICKILNILPENFNIFKSSWMLLTKDNEKTLEEFTAQLCMFERNSVKKVHGECSNDSKSEALVANTFVKKGTLNRESCKSNVQRPCHYCGLNGHWIRRCKKWIADGKPKKGEGKESIQSNVADSNVALITLCEETVNSVEGELDTGWYIDNGATKHLTNNLSHFVNYEEFTNRMHVRAAGKEILEAHGKGTILVKSCVGDKEKLLTLKNVWYVPKISKNLVSVLAAQDCNEKSEFFSNATSCFLKVNGEIVLAGTRNLNGSLYRASIQTTNAVNEVTIVTASNDKSCDTLQLFHERWGHQDQRHVKEKLEKEMNIKVPLDNKLCDSCILEKPIGCLLEQGQKRQNQVNYSQLI